MKIPVLMYHSISNGQSNLSVSLKNFDAQLSYMSSNNYKTTSFDKLELVVEKNKYFIITFDDGYEDVFLNALPILKKYNYTATCFFVTDYIGKYNVWDENKKNFKKLNLMSLDQLKLWTENNMLVGSHTTKHMNLNEISYQERLKQIVEPKIFFEKELSINVDTFSYPFGSVDDSSKSIVKDNYKYAVTTNRSRYSKKKFSNLEIPRVPVNKNDGMFKFFLKVETVYEDLKFKK